MRDSFVIGKIWKITKLKLMIDGGSVARLDSISSTEIIINTKDIHSLSLSPSPFRLLINTIGLFKSTSDFDGLEQRSASWTIFWFFDKNSFVWLRQSASAAAWIMCHPTNFHFYLTLICRWKWKSANAVTSNYRSSFLCPKQAKSSSWVA